MASLKQVPSTLDIYITKGDDFTFSLHTNVDLSTYRLMARSGDMEFQVVMVSAYDYNIVFTRQQTNNIVKDKAWTLEWIDPNGAKRTIITGNIKVS